MWTLPRGLGFWPPLCCLVLNCLKLTSLFFMFRCIGFCFVFFLTFVFFAFSCYKDWWKKLVLKSDRVFAVNVVVHRCFNNQNRWCQCVGTVCSVIFVNVKARFTFSEIMVEFPSVFGNAFFNNDSDFLISTKVWLSHLFCFGSLLVFFLSRESWLFPWVSFLFPNVVTG